MNYFLNIYAAFCTMQKYKRWMLVELDEPYRKLGLGLQFLEQCG